jgi:hypothetical protein
MPNKPDSKKLRMLKRLTAHLEGITPVNGYDFDLTGRVYRGRNVLSLAEAEDAISILEAPRPIDANGAGAEKLLTLGEMILLIQGWPTDDRENPSDAAYALLAATEQRLSMISELDSYGDPKYLDIGFLGVDSEGDREISEFRIGQGIVRPPQEGVSRLAMFYLPVVIGVASDHRNPYL